MDKALGIQNTMVDNVVLLASRLLLAWKSLSTREYF